MELRDAYIVAYGRSPYSRARKGELANVHPVTIGGVTLKGVLAKIPQLKPEDIDDVIVGCAQPKGIQDTNMARLISIRAGIPDSVPAMTVNRFCSSGSQTVALACHAIMCGEAECIVAGGTESMSLVNMYPDAGTEEKWVLEHDPGEYISMGETAENVAADYHVARVDMERMACESHAKAAFAQEHGYFDDQIIPFDGEDRDGNHVYLDHDNGIRPETTMEGLATLKPCFRPDGVVTAATSSQMTDGAGFVVVMSKEKMEELGVKPVARFVGSAVKGVPSRIMGMGPAVAVPKVMALTGLTVDDMDVIELNEAFASQSLACMELLHMDREKVNPDGGAMALGHPLGASGAMLIVKALSRLKRTGGRYALITMCIGGGQGFAGIFEMC
ncbi:MAG: thiolase family protein [Lachnospiraceae bacterium]|nr:thiolase family protein [Lachnospiraceae bacterium]